VIQEEFDGGLSVTTTYDHSNRPTQRMLPDGSQILYEYDGPFLRKINRLNASGDLLYSHTYDQFDLSGRVLSETGFFNSSYQYDKAGRRIAQTNPYFTEDLAYDESGNLLRYGDHSYGHDAADQLTFSSEQGTLTYDKRYNRIQKNSDRIEIDALNQIEDLSYDRNGNLLQEGFKFDEFNQLVEAGNETIRYDALGRRIQKGGTSYLYFGNDEVAAFENGQAKELKILGIGVPIAIEMAGTAYFPIADVQGTIRMLIDPKTKEVAKKNSCDVFGVGLSQEIPYAYTGKRYDAESGLVYFGKRYYIPGLGRWLTIDPIGPVDHSNLYQYVFNNPYRYSDPYGESVGGYLLGLSEIVLGGALIFTGGVLEIASFGGYTIACGFQMSAGATLIGSGLAMTAYHAQDMKMPAFSSRNPSLPSDHMSGTTLPTYNLDSTVMQRNKKGGVEKTLSNDPLNDPNLEDVSHPEAKKRGHHQLKDKKTGETIQYDKGKPYTSGHEAHDHYHRPNPNSIGDYDKYLDANGTPVPKGSQPSHLYPPDWVWWN